MAEEEKDTSGTETSPAVDPSAATQTPPSWQQELDARLEQRDQRNLQVFNEMIGRAMAEVVNAVRPQQQEIPRNQYQPPAISDDDFSRSPAEAVQRFVDAKLQPLAMRAAMPQAPDPYGMMALIEHNKAKLREKFGDDYVKYEKPFEYAIGKADPRELTVIQKMDAAFRVVRSMAQDAEAENEGRSIANQQGRIDRGRAGAMVSGGARTQVPAPSEPNLSDDEKAMLERMGMSAESYREYSNQDREFTFGSAKEKK